MLNSITFFTRHKVLLFSKKFANCFSFDLYYSIKEKKILRPKQLEQNVNEHFYDVRKSILDPWYTRAKFSRAASSRTARDRDFFMKFKKLRLAPTYYSAKFRKNWIIF